MPVCELTLNTTGGYLDSTCELNTPSGMTSMILNLSIIVAKQQEEIKKLRDEMDVVKQSVGMVPPPPSPPPSSYIVAQSGYHCYNEGNFGALWSPDGNTWTGSYAGSGTYAEGVANCGANCDITANCEGFSVRLDSHSHPGHCVLLSYTGSDFAAEVLSAPCVTDANSAVLMRHP